MLQPTVSLGPAPARSPPPVSGWLVGTAQRDTVRELLPSSLEGLLHDTGNPEFLLRLDIPGPAAELLSTPRIQRAIGMVYSPGTERQNHYFRARTTQQFDAVIHIDRTTAVQPLEPDSRRDAGTMPQACERSGLCRGRTGQPQRSRER
ncbi:erythromycin esterase family protein [Nocardia sp. X0981]